MTGERLVATTPAKLLAGDTACLTLGGELVTVVSCHMGRHSGSSCYVVRTLGSYDDEHYLAPDHTVFVKR